MTMTTVHRQVHVRHGDTEADVDELLAPLILACWRVGIQTVMSCQHFDPASSGSYDTGRPLVWIVFPGEHDAKRFLQLAPPGGLWFDVRPIVVTEEHAAGATQGVEFVGQTFWHVSFPRHQLRAMTRAVGRRAAARRRQVVRT